MDTVTKDKAPSALRTAKRIKVKSSKANNEASRTPGTRQTFIVEVMGNQNSTWQGYVIRAEDKSRQPFRSALELIRLMDDALDDSDN